MTTRMAAGRTFLPTLETWRLDFAVTSLLNVAFGKEPTGDRRRNNNREEQECLNLLSRAKTS